MYQVTQPPFSAYAVFTHSVLSSFLNPQPWSVSKGLSPSLCFYRGWTAVKLEKQNILKISMIHLLDDTETIFW